jgi:hypothetical protein
MPVQDIPSDSIPDDIGSPGKGDSSDTIDLGGLSLGGGIPDVPPAPQVKPVTVEPPEAKPAPGDDKPAGEPEPPEAEPEAAEYTEADLVKELNLGEFKTVKDALEARDTQSQQHVQALKSVFSKAGIDLLGNNIQELQQELEWRLTHNSGAPQAPETRQPDAESQAAPLSLDKVFTKWEGKVEFDDAVKGFYQDLVATAVAEVQGQVNPPLRGASGIQDSVQLLLDHQWYSDAKSAAGDASIPPFEEARRLLNTNPKLREWASQRREIFGDVNANPMKDVFAQWQGSRNALGLTNAEIQKRNEAAIKARNFKRTLTPGAVPKAKPKTSHELTNKELGDAMHSIPISEAFRQG